MPFFTRFSVLLLIAKCSALSSPCSRFQTGDFVTEPVQYSSILGLLEIRLEYKAGRGPDGSMQFCYLTQDGKQSPTLLVWPGDRLRLTLTNFVDASAYTGPGEAAAAMANFGTNIHFHGMAVSPQPGQDFAVTVIVPGQTFTYELDIPPDHPLGLHW